MLRPGTPASLVYDYSLLFNLVRPRFADQRDADTATQDWLTQNCLTDYGGPRTPFIFHGVIPTH